MELRSRARCDAGPCDSVTVRVTPLRDTADTGTSRVEFAVIGDTDTVAAPAPVPVTVRRVAGAACHVYTAGPHVVTWDGARHELLATGTFLLAAARDQYEVQLRTWRCGPAACVCGIVARDGEEVVTGMLCILLLSSWQVVSLDTCHGQLGDTLPVLRVARLGGGPVTSQLLEARGGKILLVR